MSILIRITFSSAICILFLSSCSKTARINESPITMEAHYMQYACGDWNDDMKVMSTEDSAYSFMVGKDIDPVFESGETEISEWFFKNRTEEFGMTYRIKGYLEKCAESGCGGLASRFWITEITKLDGTVFEM